MIIRLVKLTVHPDQTEHFLRIYGEAKDRILEFPGCEHLELWQDVSDHNIFFTHSHWRTEKDLENYRNSALFESVWSSMKPLFRKRTQAWSTRPRSYR